MQNFLQMRVVENHNLIPRGKGKKSAENIVIHEVIHNIHKKVPQVWYKGKLVKFESLFWNL